MNENVALPIRIFEMNDHIEWWIGRGTQEQMREAYRAEYGDDTMADSHLPQPLSDQQLDSLRYFYGDEDEALTLSKSRTFREQLAIDTEAGVPAPCMFACQEW
jgi:hypothetical protein